MEKAQTLFDQALILTKVGYYNEALDYYKQSLEIAKTLPEAAYLIPKIVNNIGDVYLSLKDFEKGEQYFEESLKLAKENGFFVLEDTAQAPGAMSGFIMVIPWSVWRQGEPEAWIWLPEQSGLFPLIKVPE